MSRISMNRISATPVAEGVRFQVGNYAAFAVRNQNKDLSVRIRREKHPMRRIMKRIPFVRGMLRLFSVVFGLLDATSESGELEPQDIARGSRFERGFADLFRVNPVSLVAFGSAIIMPILMIGLIFVAPWAVEEYLLPLISEKWTLPYWMLSRTGINAIICGVRIVCTILCAGLVSHLRIMNRFCMYRGAIHKVYNAHIHSEGTRMNQDYVSAQSKISRRCDAAFVLIVVLLSMIAFACVRTHTLHVQLLVRVMMILGVAGIINEPIQLLEKLPPKHPLAWLLAPVMWIERLFVIEPHPQMVEVALCAYNAAKENNI